MSYQQTNRLNPPKQGEQKEGLQKVNIVCNTVWNLKT